MALMDPVLTTRENPEWSLCGISRPFLKRLSEKGYEPRSNGKFGRYAGVEIGQKGPSGAP